MGILPNDSCFSDLEARIDTIGTYFIHIGPRTFKKGKFELLTARCAHLRRSMTNSYSKGDGCASFANIPVCILTKLGRPRERFQLGGLL